MKVIVKVKFIEMVWDNYQGSSGKPITRSVLMEFNEDIRVSNLFNHVIDRLQKQGIKENYSDNTYDLKGILSIEILPVFN